MQQIANGAFFYLALRLPKMAEFCYIGQLATDSYLFAHIDSICNYASHRSNVPYAPFPSLISGYCFVHETPTSVNGFLRKKHKAMAGCDCGLRNSRLVLLIKRLCQTNKRVKTIRETLRGFSVLLRPIVFRFMSAFIERVHPCYKMSDLSTAFHCEEF